MKLIFVTLTANGYIVVKFATDIQGPLRKHLHDFGDLLTFPLVPPAGI